MKYDLHSVPDTNINWKINYRLKYKTRNCKIYRTLFIIYSALVYIYFLDMIYI